ncbi:BZ3500_MvSof-1268-A1-R1_Chr1-1g01145 [Microbotryum saponariae]|uniref:BZ3500_MvSof-1268-A1-R1_Chr1-1g01145 protein n=1 Tax=Microbotryum saponariae TaxID=289078 RepID=A0A2X0L435_9BASI|nr:BZ3500_MvSof-1268-A1-R1_Chr1-1g01145 [Microbotryum saponariae]SCZ93501.1 BZ3501_MvSof-1269-A2-R1_Chr1-1g00742 [Microbotryum saponariae]
MLLRFMRVDTLHAAGAAARVPSRIKGSSETGDTVLGVTTPEGETLTDVVPSDPDSPLLDRPMGGGGADGKVVGGSAELGGVKEEGSTTMGKAGMGDGIGGLVAGAGVTVPLLTEKQHEALYGPRRTLFLVVVLVVGGLGMWAWLKWRRKRRVARRAGKGKGREREREGDYVRLGERKGSIRLGEEEERVGFGFGGPSRAGGGAGTGAGLAVDTRQVFDIGEDDDEEEEGEDEDEDEETLGDLGASPGGRRRGSD